MVVACATYIWWVACVSSVPTPVLLTHPSLFHCHLLLDLYIQTPSDVSVWGYLLMWDCTRLTTGRCFYWTMTKVDLMIYHTPLVLCAGDSFAISSPYICTQIPGVTSAGKYTTCHTEKKRYNPIKWSVKDNLYGISLPTNAILFTLTSCPCHHLEKK